MARRVPRGQETRDRILETALRLFAARGYARVTIEEIASAAEVTKGAVYHWFTDKDDLGRELQHSLYERLSARSLQALDPEGDAVSNMMRTFTAYTEALGDEDEARFFLRDAWVIPALDAAGRKDHEDSVELVRGVLSAAMARGELRTLDADALARVLLGMWAEATLIVLRTGDRAAARAVVAHFLESLRTTSTSTNPSETTSGTPTGA